MSHALIGEPMHSRVIQNWMPNILGDIAPTAWQEGMQPPPC